MLMQIFTHTPTWVFMLLAALLVLGASQLRSREVAWRRVFIMPIIMLGLAISGVYSAFGQSSTGSVALLAWLFGAAVAAALAMRLPVASGTLFHPGKQTFSVPGSVRPMLMILAIFCVKYVVGITLALHPDYAGQSEFALSISGLYGVFSGIFAARALRMWRLAHITVHGAASVAQA